MSLCLTCGTWARDASCFLSEHHPKCPELLAAKYLERIEELERERDRVRTLVKDAIALLERFPMQTKLLLMQDEMVALKGAVGL